MKLEIPIYGHVSYNELTIGTSLSKERLHRLENEEAQDQEPIPTSSYKQHATPTPISHFVN